MVATITTQHDWGSITHSDIGSIETDDFVLLHTPRCAGHYLVEVFRAHGPAGWNTAIDFDKNGRAVRELDAATRARPLIGIVRNPWDWYVSWFYHNDADPLFADCERTIAGFQRALPRMVAYTDDPLRCQWRNFTEADDSLLPNLTLIQYEDLLTNLQGAIEALGVTVPPGFIASAQAHGRVNVGEERRARHAPVGDPELPDSYADHYTQTEIDLVAAAEAPLIAHAGYTFS
jgi:hypothetical protein